MKTPSPKTTAQRQAAYRARKAQIGTAEVRGIFAHPDDHPAIKNAATAITAARRRQGESK